MSQLCGSRRDLCKAKHPGEHDPVVNACQEFLRLVISGHHTDKTSFGSTQSIEGYLAMCGVSCCEHDIFLCICAQS